MPAKDRTTFERVRECLEYDSATGWFTWTMEAPCRRHRGARAGCATRNAYKVIGLDGRSYCAQRLAWLLHYGRWPDGEVDHINHDKHDNRIANLRDSTKSQNQTNRNQKETALPRGVKLTKCGTFRAVVNKDGRRMYFGTHATVDEAAAAAAMGRRRLFGEFSG